MIPLNRNGACFGILAVMMVFNLIACASYPDSPRSPQAGDDTYTVAEDTLLIVPQEEGVLGNDEAREGVDITLVSTGEMDTMEGGIVNMDSTGSFTYEPFENFSGTDQISYTIRNQKGKDTEGTIFFEVTPVNDPPEPEEDHVTTGIGEPVVISVLTNDSDPDNDAMTVIDVGEPGYGTVQINSDGTLLYSPQADHSGDITFFYTVEDGNGETASSTVFVTITNSDAAIRVGPDQFSTREDQPLTISVDALLANDSAPEDEELTIVGLGNIVEPGVDADNRGSVELIADTAITYTPAENFSGNASFTYTVASQSGSTASGTVTVVVEAVADPPQISDIQDREIIQGNSTGFIEFTISDADTALAALEISWRVSASNPAGLIPEGGITIGSGVSATRTIQVTPNPDYFGSATITVTVSDGELQDSDSFVLTVAAANERPTISAITNQTTTADTPITVRFTVGDDNTPEQDLRITTASSNTTLVPDENIEEGSNTGPNRSITITPATGETGTTAITIAVSDGTLTSRTSFQLTVSDPANTAPTISAISDREMDQNTTLVIPFTIDDAESDPAALSVTATTDNTTLVPSLSESGTDAERMLTITSAADQTGTAQITIEVSDGVYTTRRSFDLTVTAGDDETEDPTAPEGVNITLYSSSTTLTLSSSDSTNAGSTLLAEDDIYATVADQTLTVSAETGLLANDRSSEGDQSLEISPVNQTHLTLNADGGFRYTPPTGFVGRHIFDYVVSDGSQTAGASITFVVGGNQVPQARRDEYAAVSGETLHVSAGMGLLANDADPDNEQLTVISTGVFDTLFGGEVNIGSDGAFVYISSSDFNGWDSFAYTVSDGRDSAIGVAVIQVTP